MEDYKITLPNRSERDWEEDFEHENGNYSNRCMECKLYFYGYKRRVICKKCSTPDWVELAKRRPPEDTKDNKAWAGAWLEGEMVGYAKCMVEKVLPAASEVQQGGKNPTEDEIAEFIKGSFQALVGFDKYKMMDYILDSKFRIVPLSNK